MEKSEVDQARVARTYRSLPKKCARKNGWARTTWSVGSCVFKRVFEKNPWSKQIGSSCWAWRFIEQLRDLDPKLTGWNEPKNQKIEDQEKEKEQGWEKNNRSKDESIKHVVIQWI